MDLHLKGKSALITGGTGGIGWSTAEAFAQEGCDVAVCARNEEGVQEAVSKLEGMGVKAFGRSVDVADADALKSWVEDAAEALGGIDAVVANVSALGSGEGEEQWRRAVDIDLMHTVHLVDAALPSLKQSDHGSIVIVSSVSARRALGAQPYGTLKAALNHYGKGLAVQFAKDGIRANVVSPGTIYVEDGFWGNIKRNNPKMFEGAFKRNPMGRMGDPEEVARAIVFLSSPASSFTSGTNLLVDGAVTGGVQM
ncbi:MAG: SDR family oxidoreductase [Gemmatimonadota bacterium]|jgi:3-oxoacyl-[acyl-carrier protein] reductase